MKIFDEFSAMPVNTGKIQFNTANNEYNLKLYYIDFCSYCYVISFIIECLFSLINIWRYCNRMMLEDQAAFYILTSCPQVYVDISEDILLLLGNDAASAEVLVADNITLQSCSRDEMFVQQCLKAL